jgi:hypothetical protein
VRLNWCGSDEVSLGYVVADLQITVIAFANTQPVGRTQDRSIKARRNLFRKRDSRFGIML